MKATNTNYQARTKQLSVDKFIELTGATKLNAQSYLQANGNSLERAVEKYYSQQQEDQVTISKTDPKLKSIFDKYKDPNNDLEIDINGTMTYLEDLGIEPEDPKSLVLAYFLNSPAMGTFKREDFYVQWSKVKVNTILKMRDFLDSYQDKMVHDDVLNFQKLYNFTFDFVTEQRLMDFESAIDYWRLLFPIMIDLFGKPEMKSAIQSRTDQWYTFIENVYKRPLSRDSWIMFYSFVLEIIFDDPTDMVKYSEMSSWPSVIDEYVEYLRESGLLKEHEVLGF